MAINLQALLQGVPDISMAPPPPPNWQETVGPVQPNQYLVDQVPQTASPQGLIPQEPSLPEQPEIGVKGLDPIQNKGMFGVKGTLRDVLGILAQGLTKGRFDYGNLRRQEQFGNVLAGKYQDNMSESFVEDPLLAIQRLTEEGFGEEATKLYQQYQVNQIAAKKAELDANKAARDALNDEALQRSRRAQEQRVARELIAKTYGAISDERVLEQFNGWARKYLDDAGLEGIPLARNLKEAARYGIDPYQQERLDDYDTSLDIQEQRADTYRSVARPRSDTAVELFERYSNIPTNRRTPEQQAFIKRFTEGSRGGGSKRLRGQGASAVMRLPPPGSKVGEIKQNSAGKRIRWDGKRWIPLN